MLSTLSALWQPHNLSPLRTSWDTSFKSQKCVQSTDLANCLLRYQKCASRCGGIFFQSYTRSLLGKPSQIRVIGRAQSRQREGEALVEVLVRCLSFCSGYYYQEHSQVGATLQGHCQEGFWLLYQVWSRPRVPPPRRFAQTSFTSTQRTILWKRGELSFPSWGKHTNQTWEFNLTL